MTSPERLLQLEGMRLEFETHTTSRKRRIEILTQVRDWAEEEIPESRCQFCRYTGIYAPYHEALIEGHCYSMDGMRDYASITKVCEFCFDNLPQPDDDVAEGWSHVPVVDHDENGNVIEPDEYIDD